MTMTKPEQQELFVDLDIFTGPLDLLLELARARKIDIKNLPMVELADQYLAFLKRAGGGDLSISAEYLAMAAWLVWLKSLSMLPDEESGEEVAAFGFHLRSYATLKKLAVGLWKSPQVGRQFFLHQGEDLPVIRETPLAATALHELLQAYGEMKQRQQLMRMPKTKPVYEPERAREIIQGTLKNLPPGKWVGLESLLAEIDRPGEGYYRRSVVAAFFCAALEMAREGSLAILGGDKLPKISRRQA